MADARLLSSLRVEDLAVEVSILAPRTVLLLKSYLPEVVRGKAAVRVAGEELPVQVGTIRLGPPRILCLGPAEWWAVGQDSGSWSLEGVRADGQAQGLTLCEMTPGLSPFQVLGAGARALLAKGCGLDLPSGVFGLRSCARTRFAQVSAVIDYVQSPDRFELYVGRSYADYIREWLTAA
jgi:sarcosine oxidase subunit gamma